METDSFIHKQDLCLSRMGFQASGINFAQPVHTQCSHVTIMKYLAICLEDGPTSIDNKKSGGAVLKINLSSQNERLDEEPDKRYARRELEVETSKAVGAPQ